MKGHWIPYSVEEMAWLDANKALPISEYHAGFCEVFDRQDVAPGHLHSLRKRKGWKTGRTGQFDAGLTPWNKGVPCEPGQGGRHPNARKTQFRKGARTGRAALNYKPIGTERVNDDGYLERKIHDGLPMQSRWRLVHLVEWEAVNGPIPKSFCLKALDGDRTNTDPANWKLIPRAMLAALNGGRHKRRPGYDEAAPELRPTLLALAEVETKARDLKRRQSSAPSDRKASAVLNAQCSEDGRHKPTTILDTPGEGEPNHEAV